MLMPAVANPFTAGRWIVEPKPQTVWGLSHASWFFAMGVGGALFINRLIFGIELGRFYGMIVADLLSMLVIGIGGVILIADLGKPLRVLRALMNPRTSWISIGAICDFIFLTLAGLWVICDFDWGGARPFAGLPWAGNSALGTVFQAVAAVAAFIVIIYPGLVLAYSPSIPFWNTTLIPLEFLAFAFISALGLVPIFAVFDPASPEFLADCANLELIVLASALLLFLAHVLQGSYGHVAARLSVKRLIREDLNLPFVWGTLIAGILVPLVLVLSGNASDSELQLVLLASAGVFTLIGNWLSKYAIIKAGMYAPLL
jgi:formate-dependent nitrite reductase membrane component NrfD